MINEKNILTIILSLLKVKYTKSFSEKLYNEHPDKDSLWGLSKILLKYGIESLGLKLNEKEALLSLDVPLISVYENQFIVIYKITPNSIYYIYNREKKEKTIENFLIDWTKLVLIIESDENSMEPDYNVHRKEELVRTAEKVLLLFTCIVSGSILYIKNLFFNSLWVSLLIIINMLGVYVSYLLLQKQVHIHNRYVDKICHSIKSGNCNSVLNSSAAKLWGIFSWSEIGFTYFIFNIILIFTKFQTWVVIVNIIALPYSFWSVWYQKFKVKQWCLLCLIVQFLLWAICIVNLSFHCIHVPTIDLTEILFISCTYIILSLITHIFISKVGDEKINREIAFITNSIKMKNNIFSLLLNEQPYFHVDTSVSKILFGNIQADTLITIVTNPYCRACALMHKKVNELLKRAKDKICIQYIISSFSPSLEFTEKFLIGAYLQNNLDNTYVPPFLRTVKKQN
jgi:hypothetical protein